MVTFSLFLYGFLIFALFGLLTADPAAVGPLLLYGIGIPLAVTMMHGLMIGRIRGNGVRVSAHQFPELLAIANRHAAALHMKKLPDIFVVQAGGVLNAFATRFFGRDFVIIYSDVLAMAERRGQNAVSFIVAHELAHVQRGHLKLGWLKGPGRMIPYLGSAYSRACEYTCDRFGAHCEAEGAVDGLLVLAAGRELYDRVNARNFARQVETEKGFWVRRAELMSSHPNLPKRVAALLAAGVPLHRAAVSPQVPGVMMEESRSMAGTLVS